MSLLSVEDRLLGAVDVSSRDLDLDEGVEVEADDDPICRVGTIRIVEIDGSIILSDPNATTLDEALGLHEWESGTIRLVDEGVEISVWREDA